MRARTQLALSLGAVALYGCALKAGGMDHPTTTTTTATTVPATTTTVPVELGAAVVLVPAHCDAWAQQIAEDDSPWTSPDGADIVTYDSGEAGRGCATYADGYAYDGNGWHAPTEEQAR